MQIAREEISLALDGIWLTLRGGYVYCGAAGEEERRVLLPDRGTALLTLPEDVVRSVLQIDDGGLQILFESGRSLRTLSGTRLDRPYEIEGTTAHVDAQAHKSSYSAGIPEDFDFNVFRGKSVNRVLFFSNQVLVYLDAGLVLYLRDLYVHRLTPEGAGLERPIPDADSTLVRLPGEVVHSAGYFADDVFWLRFESGQSVSCLASGLYPEFGVLQVPKPDGGEHQYIL